MSDGLVGPPDIAGSFLQGAQAGNVIGDAIARYRYHRSLRTIQDDVDSGKYSSDEAGQQQLQTDIRKAAENSGIDTRDIGTNAQGIPINQSTYADIAGQQTQRQLMSAGNQIAAGNVGQGMTTAGNAYLNQGDLQAGIPLAQQGQIATANQQNAVGPDGNYNPAAGSQNVANVQGQYGNSAGANAASDDAQARRQQVAQQFAGRAAMAWGNQALGGPQQAVAYLNTALTVSPMVQGIQLRLTNDPQNPVATVDAKTGQVLGQFSANDAQQFMTMVGRDPAQFETAITQAQQAHAANTYAQQQDIYKTANDQVFKMIGDLATNESVPSKAIDGYQTSAEGALNAAKGGVKLFDATKVDKDSPQSTMMAQLPNGRMMRVTVNAPGITDSNGVELPPITFSDDQNRTYTPAQLGLDGNTLQGIQQYGEGARLAETLDTKYQDHMTRLTTAIRMATSYAKSAANATANGQGVPDMSGLSAGIPAPGSQGMGEDAHAAMHDLENPSGDPNAVSPKGATGVSQFEPATGKETQTEMQQKGLLPANAPPNAWQTDPKVGNYYLDKMFGIYESRYPGLGKILAPMAYNWGSGKVDKWIAEGMPESKIPKETKQYVSRFLAKTGGSGATAMGSIPYGPPSGQQAAPNTLPRVVGPPVNQQAQTPENTAFQQWLQKG